MIQHECSGADRLDAICFKHYGHLKGTVEAVLNANEGLAESQSLVLQAGLVINLPSIVTTTETPITPKVRLWN